MEDEVTNLNSFQVFNSDQSANPYHLQNGDSTGSILVSQVLTGDNYNTWSRSMQIAVKAKNKIGFITGAISQPASSSSLHETWERCNNMIISWILNAVSKDIAGTIIYATTAKEMWEELKNQFSQGNGPRIFQLQKELASLSQDQMSVSVYYRKFKCLWDELLNYNQIPNCTCGALKSCSCGAVKFFIEYQHRQHVIQFLMGLNDNFSHIRGQILILDPMPTITKVFSLIIQEKKQ